MIYKTRLDLNIAKANLDRKQNRENAIKDWLF